MDYDLINTNDNSLTVYNTFSVYMSGDTLLYYAPVGYRKMIDQTSALLGSMLHGSDIKCSLSVSLFCRNMTDYTFAALVVILDKRAR